MNWIVKNFLRGVIIVVPIALTIYLIYEGFTRIDRLVKLPIPGAGFALTILLMILVGALASNFFVRKFLGLTNAYSPAPPAGTVDLPRQPRSSGGLRRRSEAVQSAGRGVIVRWRTHGRLHDAGK